MSKIEWTDRTWNPVRGCSRVSEGCRNCYAERLAGRFSGPGLRFEGFAELHFNDATKGGDGRFRGRWTGRVELIPSKLAEPLSWRKPLRVFVNSMSDLFHESLPNEAIAAVFGVMAAASCQTFQVLTKRPERMREWFAWLDTFREPSWEDDMGASRCWAYAIQRGIPDASWPGGKRSWPLPNVWLGVSVEDQATADARIPLLLQTPAAKRFVSYEPALAGVDFGRWLPICAECARWLGTRLGPLTHRHPPCLDWIIVGGESGPGARPFDVAWARYAVELCRAAGVRVFVKQLGARPYADEATNHADWLTLEVKNRKGGDMAEWPEDLRIREFPHA